MQSDERDFQPSGQSERAELHEDEEDNDLEKLLSLRIPQQMEALRVPEHISMIYTFSLKLAPEAPSYTRMIKRFDYIELWSHLSIRSRVNYYWSDRSSKWHECQQSAPAQSRVLKRQPLIIGRSSGY